MCLVGVAIAVSERFPLVIAANRDEFFARGAAPLAWWTPRGSAMPILAGRDLRGGGTWLGASAAGRIALVTNVREPDAVPSGAPTRGEIVARWLRGDLTLDALEEHVRGSGFAGVNVLAFDGDGTAAHVSNRGTPRRKLDNGIHALSNASVDTPWPKVVALHAAMKDVLGARDRSGLEAALFAALADQRPAADASLPATGVPHELERALSPAFIRIPTMGYGTRCSSILVQESAGALSFVERAFAANGARLAETRFTVPPGG